jgi:hypothetical protein
MKKIKFLLLAIPLMAFNCSPDEQAMECECRLETFEIRTQFFNGMPRLVRVLVNPGEFEPNDCSLSDLGYISTGDPSFEQKWNCVQKWD